MEAQHRLHALDNIRAHMMLLGIVFHTAINYSIGQPNPDWPFRDEATDPLISGLVSLIHVFRMPVFFVVAGFFAALLIHRRSIGRLLQNRTLRIAVPFALFLLPITWLCGNGFQAANAAMDGQAFTWLPLMQVPDWNLFHLWFLYFLMFFYVVLALLSGLFKLTSTAGGRLDTLNRWIWKKHAPLVFGALSGICLFVSGSAHVAAPLDFVPDLTLFFYYLVFFLGGTSLYRADASVKVLSGKARYFGVLLIVSLIGFVLAEMLVLDPAELENKQYSLLGGLFQGTFVWCLSLLIVCAYLKFASQESRWGRYMTDASYWVYLVHLPMTIWFPMLMADWPMGAWSKFMLCLGATTVIAVVSYHFLVRSTALGDLLNGKRYPFSLPGVTRNDNRERALGRV